MALIPFSVASHYSSVGASDIKDLIARSKDLGLRYSVLTDRGNFNGAIEHYLESKKAGLSPIVGIQVYLKDQWSPVEYEKKGKGMVEKTNSGLITVHFKNESAYKYFCKLTLKMEQSAIKEDGLHKPIVELADLAPIAKDITVGTAGLDGILAKLLIENKPELAEKCYFDLKTTFGQVYLEIQPRPVTSHWIKPMWDRAFNLIRRGFFKENEEFNDYTPEKDYAKALNAFYQKMQSKHGGIAVLGMEVHFAKPESKIVQDAKLSKDGEALVRYPISNHFLTEAEVRIGLVSMGYSELAVDELIANTNEWATQFDGFKLTTAKDRWVLPAFEGDSIDWVSEIVKKNGRMDWNDPSMVARFKEEIRVLKYNGQLDVLPYFKPLVELTEWCREKGLTYNLRGSAGGSFLVYLLGISGFNPMKHNLSFERFINEGRIKGGNLPDLDLDLANRELAIEYLKEKYGDRFMQLSIDVKVKIKSAIKDAERAILGSVRPETESLCVSIPNPDQGADEHDYVFGHVDDDGQYQPGVLDTMESLQHYAKDNPKIWDTVKEMLGIARNKSSHACSFLIADAPITDYIPVTTVGDALVTGYSPKSIEAAGLIKYDFLGVNTLKDISEALKIVKELTGETLDVYNLPEDPATYKSFARGDTATVFQFNTVTVAPFLKQTRPHSIDQLSSITALARPGTLDAKESKTSDRTLADVYVARVQGEPIKYTHPDLEPILKNTYGVMLYQEGLMRIFTDIAGYTAEQADNVRRAVGKKDEKTLKTLTEDLKNKCLVKGWTEAQITLLVEQIMASARYSFNASHSCLSANQQIRTNKGNKTVKEIFDNKNLQLAFVDEQGSVKYESPSNYIENGLKEVFEVEFDDGSKIQMTADHKVWYNNAWVTLSDFLQADKEIEVVDCVSDSFMPLRGDDKS